MGKMTGEARAKAAAEGARTVPPREHGGNCDIKDLSRGSKVFFPVYVDGAGLSVGDLHFSQGDGEITFCGAIEMAGWVHMKVTLIKGGMAKYGIKNPIFKPSVITPQYNDYLIFEGISVDEAGKQYYLDVNVAYRQACLNAIEYLKKFGYSGAQAYSILGHGARAGPHQRRGRCAQLLRHALAAHADLRLRHQSECRGPGEDDRRQHRHAALARPGLTRPCLPTTTPAANAAASRRCGPRASATSLPGAPIADARRRACSRPHRGLR